MTEPIIDISMSDGTNLGAGGADYNAQYSGGTFQSGRYAINKDGYLSVPTPFMSGTDPWTVALRLASFTPSSNTYSRIARGDVDVPSLFYTKSVDSTQAKLAYGSANTAYVSVLNDALASVDSSNGAIPLSNPDSANTLYVFRNDGQYVTLWINGIKTLQEDSSRYTSDKWASKFSIGDDEDSSRSDSYLECDLLRLWNTALSDEEVLCADAPRDTASSSSYYNHKVIVTKNYNDTMVHLTALLKVDSSMTEGSIVKASLRGFNAVNMASASNNGGYIFSDESGQVSNGQYVEALSSKPTHTQVVADSALFIAVSDQSLTATPSTPYIKVPIILSGTVPYSFKISNISVTVDNTEKEIVALGTFHDDSLEQAYIKDESVTPKKSIRGNTVGVSNPRPDWEQSDAQKANFILNKPDYFVALPLTAKVGQYLRIAAVDEDGKVTLLEAADVSSGSSEIPAYTEADYGKFLAAAASGLVWLTPEVTGGSGSGGGFAPRIIIDIASGATLTCSNGSTTLSAVSVGNPVTFDIPEYGDWTISATLDEVTEDFVVSVTAVKEYRIGIGFIQESFAETSWESIAYATKYNKVPDTWSVGDTKELTLTFEDGTEEIVTMEIVGFKHDTLLDGSGVAHISLLSKYVLAQTHEMNPSDGGDSSSSDSDGGWSASSLHSYVETDIYNAIPSEIRGNIKTVTKLCSQGNSGFSTIKSVAAKCWIPSVSELGFRSKFSSTSYVPSAEGSVYERFNGVSSWMKTLPEDSITGIEWWTRSPYNLYEYWCSVNKAGTGGNYRNSYATYGVVFGFCL